MHRRLNRGEDGMAKLWIQAVAASAAVSMGAAASAQSADVVARGNLQWKEIVPGASFAPAYGDWEKGAHGKYVQIAKSAQIPLHIHSNDYHAVFVSGRMANLFEGGQRVEIAPGDYFYMAAKRPHAHECLTEEPCFFYTYGDGSWDLEVVESE
jgi:quercetin dioxygenase-like cupin family protein